MNCEEAQQEILMADDPGAAAARPEIAEHVRGCGLCGALVGQLTKLEVTAKSLPIKGDSAERPFPLVTERMVLVAKNAKKLKRFQWLSRAVAAVLAITVGLIAITMMTSTRPARAEAVYGDLVAWNLKISQAAPAMRDQLYREKLGDMKKEVDSLTAGDRALAEKLLSNAQLLVQANDPLAETSRFVEIAKQLQACEKGLSDKTAAAQMETLYQNVLTQGIEPEIKRVDPKTLPADQKLKFEELQKWVQPQGAPASLPVGPGAMIPAIPAGGGTANWTQIRAGGTGSGAAAVPTLPANPLHDFMPGKPFVWTPPSGVVAVTGSGGAAAAGSHGGTKSSGTPADSSPSSPSLPPSSSTVSTPPAAGGVADGSSGESLGGGKSDGCADLPTITQGTTGPAHTAGGLGDLADPGDFDSGTAAGTGGSGRHTHGDGNGDGATDWTWGTKPSDYADGSMPGWMKCVVGGGTDGLDGTSGRHVADEVPMSSGCVDDTDVTNGPDGSPLFNYIKHSQAVSGFVDFDGAGAVPAGAGTVALPEPGAGLILGLGAALLMRRRKRAG